MARVLARVFISLVGGRYAPPSPDFNSDATVTNNQVKVWCIAIVATVDGSAGRTPDKFENTLCEKHMSLGNWPMEFARRVSKSQDIENTLGVYTRIWRVAQTVAYVVPD